MFPSPSNSKGVGFGGLAKAAGTSHPDHSSFLFFGLRFVRRKKIKCDGCEPTCSQCSISNSQCTWLQTKDRAALSRQYVLDCFCLTPGSDHCRLSYVQELEARLLHMESLFAQIAPALEQHVAPPSTSPDQLNPPTSINPEALTSAASTLRSIAPKVKTAETPLPIKSEDSVSELFGQLALDEYGHMRWIGGSSTMSLIQSFKALTSSPLHRISPMEEDPQAPGPSVNKLYFPAAVFFGKVHALPGPEEVEFPERDLADKLVSITAFLTSYSLTLSHSRLMRTSHNFIS